MRCTLISTMRAVDASSLVVSGSTTAKGRVSARWRNTRIAPEDNSHGFTRHSAQGVQLEID
jgi:hypothetical protein